MFRMTMGQLLSTIMIAGGLALWGILAGKRP
jgi:prolipoprotein diacylglyceryltransferase